MPASGRGHGNSSLHKEPKDRRTAERGDDCAEGRGNGSLHEEPRHRRTAEERAVLGSSCSLFKPCRGQCRAAPPGLGPNNAPPGRVSTKAATRCSNLQ